MKKLPRYVVFILLLSLGGCTFNDEVSEPLVGIWKASYTYTFRIKYASGGIRYDQSLVVTLRDSPPPDAAFGKNGIYRSGTLSGMYKLTSIDGKKAVVIDLNSRGTVKYSYTLNATRLSLTTVEAYSDFSPSALLQEGKNTLIYLPAASFPGLSTASSVEDMIYTFEYTKI